MKSKSSFIRTGNPCWLVILALVVWAAVLFPSLTFAQSSYTMVATDGGGASSLNSGSNWTPAGAPAPDAAGAAGDTYTVPSGSFTLRTPTTANNYTIYGTIIMTGGSIGMKGYGKYTFDNLQLNGGGLYDSGTGGPGAGQNNSYVYGSINLTASSQIRSDNAVGTTNFIYAVITNSPSISPVPTLSFNTGGTVFLGASNTFTGNMVIDNNTLSPTLQLGTNNATPSTAALTLGGGSTGTPTIFDMNGFSTTVANLLFSSGTIMGMVTNTAAGTTSTLSIGYGNLTSYTMNYGNIADNPVSGGTVALTMVGPATYTLNTADTYHGRTTISSGTLALGASGSINNSSGINIAAGGTFDVSAVSSPYLCTNLTASGTGASNATINGASGGALSLGTLMVNLVFTPNSTSGDSGDPALVVAQSDLTLNNNSFTVNNASGSPLGAGTYLLIQVNDGNVNQAGSPSYALTVTGSGIAAHTTAAIQISGGSVNLVVTANANPTPTFSNLTASPTVTFGTASVTLSGQVSAAGPIYPANGEPVTVSINGNIQATTITDGAGDFSISYNLSGLPASATPYTITYSYSGDGSLGAAMNTSTTLTIQPATPVFSGLTASQTVAYGTAGVTLGGKVSAGSVYPASGENIVISINGSPQTNVVNDSTGDFSFSYNLLSIPFSAATYAITYSYGGDGSLSSAVNTSTSITIQTNSITETLQSSDTINNSSLTNYPAWVPATTVYPTSPLATNYDFIVTGSMRTPTNTSDYIVEAHSFTVASGGFITCKGPGTLTISNLILSGGTLKNAGTAPVGPSGGCAIAGGITVTANSAITVDSTNTSFINIESVMTNGPGVSPAITCSGGGTVIFSGQNTFNGSVAVTGSSMGYPTILQLGVNNALPAGISLTLNSGASSTPPGILDLNGYSTTVTNLTFTTAVNLAYVTNSALGTTGTLTLGNGNATETLQYGNIADAPGIGGTVGLAKVGTGTLTVNNTLTYSGNTTISAGMLALGSSGSLPDSDKFNIAAGATFDVSALGFYDVVTGQILAGGGTVNVNGTLQVDGTIAPAGTLTIDGSLTINGNLSFTLNKSLAQSNDVVTVDGSLNNTGSGTLTVTNLGPALVAGDQFFLFNQPLPNGANLTINPPAGVTISNGLAIDGSITVLTAVNPTPPQPHITGITLSGTSLVINGTNGMASEQYNVLTTTNLTLPLSQWTVLPTNTFSGGSFSITNAVNPYAPQNFYILRTP